MAEVFVDPAFHLTALTFGFNKLKVQYPEACVWGSNFLGRCVQGPLVLVGVFCCFGFGGGVWFFEFFFFLPFFCFGFFQFVLSESQLAPYGKLSNACKVTQREFATYYFTWDSKTHTPTFYLK